MKADMSSRVPPIWMPDSFRQWILIVSTLLVVLFTGVLMSMPLSWLYSDWAPARDFRQASLESVVRDFEVTGVLPRGTTWASEELKHRSVTVRYSFFHESQTVIGIVAGAAGIVIEGPAYAGCSICGIHIAGPAHIRAAIGSEPNIQWYRPKDPPAAAAGEPRPLAGRQG
jgi:hypothetical protein